jgi:hypothetical protein
MNRKADIGAKDEKRRVVFSFIKRLEHGEKKDIQS